ncbi:MAG: hypothetical protein ACHQT9_04585 [Candidatus Saccharimonadales bacterium]
MYQTAKFAARYLQVNKPCFVRQPARTRSINHTLPKKGEDLSVNFISLKLLGENVRSVVIQRTLPH